MEIRLTKEFGRPDDLGRIIEELSGKAGPLSDFRLRRERKLTAVDYRLEGTLDARALTGLDNAPGLLARLEDAGVDSRRVRGAAGPAGHRGLPGPSGRRPPRGDPGQHHPAGRRAPGLAGGR